MHYKLHSRFRVLAPNFLLLLVALFLPYFAQSQTRIEGGGASEILLDDSGGAVCTMHNGNFAGRSHMTEATTDNIDALGAVATRERVLRSDLGAEIVVISLNFDPDFSEEQFEAAAASFESAAEIWGKKLTSDVPIFVLAAFEPLADGVLGQASSGGLWIGIPGNFDENTVYVDALADKLLGFNLDPGRFEIITSFSTRFPNFYYGLDDNPPAGDFDFRTIVLHELGHGLGISGSGFVDNATETGFIGFSDQFYFAYDRLILTPEEGDGEASITTIPSGTRTLGKVLLEEGPLDAIGPNIQQALGGGFAKIFTVIDSDVLGFEIPGLTDVWRPGSSYSHIDFFTYDGTENSLMVPFASRGEAYSDPGPVTMAILKDIGWGIGATRGRPGFPGRDDADEEEEETASTTRGTSDDDSEGETAEQGTRGGGSFGRRGRGRKSADLQLTAFPNPTTGEITLQMPVSDRKLTAATLFDFTGREIAIPSPVGTKGNARFNLSGEHIAPGVYSLRVAFSDDSVATLRVVKTN